MSQNKNSLNFNIVNINSTCNKHMNELLGKMNCFMNVLFIFTVLKLRLF